MAVLEINDLYFSYKEKKKKGKRGKEILKGVSFSLEKGECFCIFGPNGCGKTTVLDCILGGNKVTSGEILLNGLDITKLTSIEKAKQVAYVSQKSDGTFQFSVFQMVLMGRTAYSGMFSSPGKEDEEIASATIHQLNLDKYMDHPYTKLSGGEAQLVKIARAIAQGTDLIIFDEPTAHLDFRHELNVIRFIASIVKNQGISIVMATHFLNHAFFLESCGLKTKVALMEDGAFGAVGTPSEVLNSENMERIFKVKTKTFYDLKENSDQKYIIPVDFCEE